MESNYTRLTEDEKLNRKVIRKAELLISKMKGKEGKDSIGIMFKESLPILVEVLERRGKPSRYFNLLKDEDLNFIEMVGTKIAEMRKIKFEKTSIDINKKNTFSKVDKKVSLIQNKLGTDKGSIGIVSKWGNRYILFQRVEEKGKKDKQKALFSGEDVTFLQAIGEALAKKFDLVFSPVVIEKTAKKTKAEANDGVEVDHSIFKEYNGHLFIMVSFGCIWLETGKMHTKRNYEKIDGVKIFELNAAGKFSTAYIKCSEKLKSYNKELQDRILKEVIRLGDSDDRNSVRIAMGIKPVKPYFDEATNRINCLEVNSLQEVFQE